MTSALESLVAFSSILATVILLTLLVARELLIASGSPRGRVAARILTIATVPLLLGFAAIVTLRLGPLLAPSSSGTGAPGTPGSTGSPAPTLEPGETPPTTGPDATGNTPSGLDTFDALATGRRPDEGWRYGPAEADIGVAAVPTGANRSLRLSSEGERVVACRALTLDEATPVDVDIMLERPGAPRGDDGALLRPRAGRNLLEPLLAMENEEFALRQGGAMRSTGEGVQPGIWYRLGLDLDPEGGRYGLRISDRQLGTVVFEQAGIRWPPGWSEVDGLCFSPPAVEGASLYIDNVRVP